ncbi:MAG: hypothetical protein LHW48_10795, partial [Candidatus Cloacimonetes bacterium]|nr:hypothetical protein [Candidatus Cloacimonadota bacterium]
IVTSGAKYLQAAKLSINSAASNLSVRTKNPPFMHATAPRLNLTISVCSSLDLPVSPDDLEGNQI